MIFWFFVNWFYTLRYHTFNLTLWISKTKP